MTVRAYIRVSTGAQVEGYSLDAQRAKIEAWAAYQGLSPVKVYEDAGVSGQRDDRPGLATLLLDLQSGDTVVVHALSRLARGGAVQLLGIVRDIQECGARVVFLEENIDTETSTGRLMLTVLAGLAELEVEQTRTRSALGKTQAALQGVYPQNPKTLPTGWTKGEDGRIVESDAADTVRFIFSRGKASLRSTAEALNAAGVPTRDGKVGGWEVFQVKRILGFEGYWRGELVYRGKSGRKDAERVVIPAPALVTREAWEAAQRGRSFNARNRQPDVFPLTGHLRCACGARLTGSNIHYPSKDGGRRTYHIYQCHTRSRRSQTCPVFGLAAPRFRYDALHDEARRILADLFSHPDDPAHLALAWQDAPRPDPHAAEREVLTRKLDALVDLHLEGLIDRDAYATRRADLQRRIALLCPPPPGPVAAMPPTPELARAALGSTLLELGEFLDLLDVEFVATGPETLTLKGYRPIG